MFFFGGGMSHEVALSITVRVWLAVAGSGGAWIPLTGNGWWYLSLPNLISIATAFDFSSLAASKARKAADLARHHGCCYYELSKARLRCFEVKEQSSETKKTQKPSFFFHLLAWVEKGCYVCIVAGDYKGGDMLN